MHSTNNHKVIAIAQETETITAPLELPSYQQQDKFDEILLRYLIEDNKRTGDFDYPYLMSPVTTEEDSISLSPLQEQRLVRYFIEHIKRTGDFDNLVLLNAIKERDSLPATAQDASLKENPFDSVQDRELTSSEPLVNENALNSVQDRELTSSEPLVNENALNSVRTTLEETQPEIISSTLALKSLLNQFAEVLRPTNVQATLRNLMEQIPQSEDNSPLLHDLKSEHQKLARYLDRLVRLAYKYAKQLETVPPEVSRRSIQKIISDLAYIRLYLEQHAQVTKIQQEIFLAHAPSVYLRRLNQYLDILPEMTAYLIHAFENIDL